jgi:hypothetical protein
MRRTAYRIVLSLFALCGVVSCAAFAAEPIAVIVAASDTKRVVSLEGPDLSQEAPLLAGRLQGGTDQSAGQ